MLCYQQQRKLLTALKTPDRLTSSTTTTTTTTRSTTPLRSVVTAATTTTFARQWVVICIHRQQLSKSTDNSSACTVHTVLVKSIHTKTHTQLGSWIPGEKCNFIGAILDRCLSRNDSYGLQRKLVFITH